MPIITPLNDVTAGHWIVYHTQDAKLTSAEVGVITESCLDGSTKKTYDVTFFGKEKLRIEIPPCDFIQKQDLETECSWDFDAYEAEKNA